jgi:hypothetical protein
MEREATSWEREPYGFRLHGSVLTEHNYFALECRSTT